MASSSEGKLSKNGSGGFVAIRDGPVRDTGRPSLSAPMASCSQCFCYHCSRLKYSASPGVGVYPRSLRAFSVRNLPCDR